MTQPSRNERIIEKAKPRIMAALTRAKRHMGDWEKGPDPRTVKKREEAAKLESGMDTTLTRMLYEMRKGQ